MIINMTTIAVRQKHYIQRTLDSLFESDGRDIPLNLILGSKDSSHVEQYRNVANIVPWNQEAQFLSREGKMRHNCSVNAIRALRFGDDELCVTCEDDIFFMKNWYGELLATIAEIERKDYVLNLGQGRTKPPVEPGPRFQPHPGRYLCGAQGIFYPSKRLRTAISGYIERHITEEYNDFLVGHYAKHYSALYNTVPALVRHIGGLSSFTQPSENRPELS